MAAHPDGFDTLDQASEIIATYTGRPKPELQLGPELAVDFVGVDLDPHRVVEHQHAPVVG